MRESTPAGRKGTRLGRVATYTGLLMASLFALMPILWAVSTSLKPPGAVLSATPRWLPEVPTLQNYLAVFRSSIPRNLFNSLTITLASVTATLVIAIPAAYSAARFSYRGRIPLLFIILVTSFIPGIAILVPLFFLAVQTGLFDTRIGLVIVYTAWQIPTAIWLLKGFFESTPRDIDEAGLIDGCSHLGAAVRLVLPIARPGIAATAVVAFVYIWNDYLLAATMVSEENLRLVSVGLFTYLSQYGIVWGELTAAMVITLLPVIALFIVVERRLVAGLSAGAVKN